MNGLASPPLCRQVSTVCCAARGTSLQAAGSCPTHPRALVPLDGCWQQAHGAVSFFSFIFADLCCSSLLLHALQRAPRSASAQSDGFFSVSLLGLSILHAVPVLLCTWASVWSRADNSVVEEPRCAARELSMPGSISHSTQGCTSVRAAWLV